jgi:hypothetical protein
MRNNSLLRQRRHNVASAVVLSASMAAALTLAGISPVLAEFEIEEAGVEKGEVELEYRGAVHWGLPKGETGGPAGALEEQEEGEVPLRQSHDFEFAWGITERFSFSTTLVTDQPKGEDFDVSTVALEGQYELIERKGNGIGLAFLAGYGIATLDDEADEIEFGPIVELASGPLLLTLNPFFTDQVGDNAETESLGFEYGWRAEYSLNKRWGIGVEMFGEIEDLANAGSFDDQPHSIGPTLFLDFGGEEDDEGNGDEAKAHGHNGGGPAGVALSMNVGVQFGLTDVTSDTALKFQGSIAF